MRNLDFGFNVITRRERDYECRDWITQDTVPLYGKRRSVTWWTSQWKYATKTIKTHAFATFASVLSHLLEQVASPATAGL